MQLNFLLYSNFPPVISEAKTENFVASKCLVPNVKRKSCLGKLYLIRSEFGAITDILSARLKSGFAGSVGSQLQVRILVLARVLGQEAKVVVGVAVGPAHGVEDLGTTRGTV